MDRQQFDCVISDLTTQVQERDAALTELTKKYKKHQEYEPLLDVIECLSSERTKEVEALALKLLREQDALHAHEYR